MLLAATASAQTKAGGISQAMLNDIRSSQKMTTADRAIANAIAANSIDALAKNHANAGAIDTHADHNRPTAVGPVLDVQRHERAPLGIRTAH